MLSFARYLAEKFFQGTKGKYDYVEVFVNPTKAELAQLAHGDPDTQIGGWVVGANLYVWDRDAGEHHDTKSLVHADAGATPIYIYYDAKTGVMAVDAASFSLFSMGHTRINTDEIVTSCQKHPAFKHFKVTDFDTYMRS